MENLFCWNNLISASEDIQSGPINAYFPPPNSPLIPVLRAQYILCHFKIFQSFFFLPLCTLSKGYVFLCLWFTKS